MFNHVDHAGARFSGLHSQTYERGDAHTVPVELSENNASTVSTSIEIHIFGVISYN